MKRWLWRILKWGGLAVVTIVGGTIALALIFKWSAADVEPAGQLTAVGGQRLHLDCRGGGPDRPTLVIEGGAGTTTQAYYWLSELLQDEQRVCRYDRPGLGFSDASSVPRDAETIAGLLKGLLEEAGEAPPYILAGHSLGGLCIRVFAELYPEAAAGLVFLDSSHPEQAEWLKMQQELAALSSGGYQFTVAEASHMSLVTNREHAAVVAEQIRQFVAEPAPPSQPPGGEPAADRPAG